MAKTNKTFNKLTNLELSIQISLSGLSFCILNRDLNTITFLKEIHFDKKLNPLETLDALKEHLENENLLEETFSKVNVIYDNNLSALVPKPLFNEDCLADYLKFGSKILKTDFITFDEILINDSVNVYVPYVNINNFIYEHFGSFTYKHISTILIEQILLTEKNSNIPKVYVNINKGSFELIAINNTKLLLFNTFEYNTKEDFIYYVLFTLEQLELNPEKISLIFIGDINAKDELYEIAYKYVRFVFLGNREDPYKYSIDSQPKTNHSNFTLIKSF
ncbi:DUF3822 family protein [Mariniflexile litorale]|uniref:DUF3822 family protein n=1 Tax=Mariniflexile litorale TaxID=3045158 RepID=A0AAU7EFH4_9FLAO|nr:DUF3822 family protein [Mariniflexile sp. KMM 9835]MDQ8212374.1 DUF3822 family protein [Mariniflexile sp. KMM 9835]